MTQYEHGPLRDSDPDEPTGFTAAIVVLLVGSALLILTVLLAVGA